MLECLHTGLRPRIRSGSQSALARTSRGGSGQGVDGGLMALPFRAAGVHGNPQFPPGTLARCNRLFKCTGIGFERGLDDRRLSLDLGKLCSLQAGIGAMVAALGGIDALIFTAGIGENSPDVRAAACANLGCLGRNLDSEKNARSALDTDIYMPDSAVRVLVIRRGRLGDSLRLLETVIGKNRRSGKRKLIERGAHGAVPLEASCESSRSPSGP